MYEFGEGEILMALASDCNVEAGFLSNYKGF